MSGGNENELFTVDDLGALGHPAIAVGVHVRLPSGTTGVVVAVRPQWGADTLVCLVKVGRGKYLNVAEGFLAVLS